METTLVKISSIKLNPNNPRLIKDDKFTKLVESIKSFPEMLRIRPIVINSDNIILGGNMRLKACKEAGLKEVHIIKAADLTEEQQREFIIKDNVGFGEWDWEMLSNEWDSEELEDWGLDTSFSEGVPTEEDWANQFEREGDTSEHDGKSQITFVLPVDYLERLKTLLKTYDDNKELALIKIVDELCS